MATNSSSEMVIDSDSLNMGADISNITAEQGDLEPILKPALDNQPAGGVMSNLSATGEELSKMSAEEAAEWFRTVGYRMTSLDPRQMQYLNYTGDAYFYVLLLLCTLLMLAVILLLYAFCCVYVMKGNLDLPGPHGAPPPKPYQVWFKNPFKSVPGFHREPPSSTSNPNYDDSSTSRPPFCLSSRQPTMADDGANFAAAQRRFQQQQLGPACGSLDDAQQTGTSDGGSTTAAGTSSRGFNANTTAFADTLRKQLSREGNESPQYISLNEDF